MGMNGWFVLISFFYVSGRFIGGYEILMQVLE
jgi:glutaredoxin-related protein